MWARQNQADGLPQCCFLARVWLHEPSQIVMQAIFGMRSREVLGEGMKEEAISLPKRPTRLDVNPVLKAIQAKIVCVWGAGGVLNLCQAISTPSLL